MICLRPFTVSDFPRLIGWVDSPQMLVQWAGPNQFSYPLTENQLREYLAGSESLKPLRRIFAVTIGSDGVAGHIEIGATDYENQTASLCRVLVSPEFRGKGICLPMVKEALRIGFDELGFRRMDLRVFAFNKAAISCYLRAGFQIEGLLRKATRVGDDYWDTVVMGILREEWKREPMDDGR